MNNFSAVVKIISDGEGRDVKGGKLFKFNSVHDTSYRDNSSMFMNITFWNERASAAERFIKRGAQVFVRGCLSVTTVESGKTFFDLNCDDFKLINSNGNNNSNGDATATDGEKKPAKKGAAVAAVPVNIDDDLPF